jgi:hypothetical protein
MRHSPDVVYRDLAADGGGVLLHLESADYLQMNQVAACIWNAIDGTRDADGVVAAVRAELPDAPSRLEDDVRSFLTLLSERGLVE